MQTDPNPEEPLTPVEPPEPSSPVRAALLKELKQPLDPVLEAETVRSIHADIQAAKDDRTDWEANLAADEEQYHGIRPKKDFPWPGCSNMSVPLTMLGIETLKPRLVEAVLGSDPIFFAVPTESYDEERRDRVELLVNWRMRTTMRIEPVVEESAHLFLTPGTVVAKVRWRVEPRRQKLVQTFPLETDIQQIFHDLFGPTPPVLTEEGDGKWKGTTPSTSGPPREILVTIRAADDGLHCLIERDVVTYEAPWVDLIPAEDFFVPARAGSDVQRMPWCTHRVWWDEYDLRTKVAMGVLDEDAVNALLESTAPPPENSQQDAMAIRKLKAETEGISPEAATSVRDMQFEVFEDYRRLDIDDDGYEEEVITWSTPSLPDRLLGWDYLDNVYAHGMRPFVVGRYLAQPGRFYGLSFPQVVRGLQDEIDTIHNWRVDAGTVQNTPAYFFRSSSTHAPGGPPITPGQGIPMDDPSSAKPIQWSGSPVFGMNEEANLYQMFERLTGITDLALGRQPNRVGATRTATGVASLLSEAGLRFKTAMLAFQRFWAEVATHVLMLDQQYIPRGLEFRVTGRHPEIIKVNDRSTISGRYDLRLSASTETLNRQVMREDASIKLQAAMNPVALQLGLIGQKGLYRLLRAYFRAYGETDPDMILEPPKMMVTSTPEQELAMFVNNDVEVHPSMAEDLGLHLQTHMQQRQDPMVQEQLGPEGIARLEMHIAETLQMAQMQQAVSMLQGGGKEGKAQFGEQAQNAEVGRQVGMGPQQPAAMTAGPGPGMGMMQ